MGVKNLLFGSKDKRTLWIAIGIGIGLMIFLFVLYAIFT